MKNKLSIALSILIIAPFVFGCRESVKEDNKNNGLTSSSSLLTENENYHVIDIKESVVTWKGSNSIGSNSHTGYIYFSKGGLMIENGRLTGGMAVIDMNTIEDEDHGKDNMLVNHLKDTDFFDVKKFPSATMVLTGTAAANGKSNTITGNLTIKGITHPVTFPAKIDVNNQVVKLNGKLVIDRTKWNVRYKSGKFYDLLADQTISDSIYFDVNIVAKK